MAMDEGLDLAREASAGDHAAFAALALRHQEMALGYALSLLRDYHLAQDATQEALLAAYRGLPALRDPAAFPAWLRGIVRHQCARVYRARSLDQSPLTDADGLAAPLHDGPERHLEVAEGFHRVLAAIHALPPREREVALLFYIKDYAQREIAAFLGVPTTTVNNRMHAARAHLRERLTMTTQQTGTIIALHGPLAEARFAAGAAPLPFSALSLSPDGPPALRVAWRAADGLTRCLVVGSHPACLATGAAVYPTGGPLLAPLDAATLAAALPALAPTRAAEPPTLLETGIKAVDLFCPLTRGGTVGLFGPSGVGRIVVCAELLANTAAAPLGVTVVAFTHDEADARGWYDSGWHDTPPPDAANGGGGGLVVLPLADSADPSSPAVLAAAALLDSCLYLSPALARSGLWPALDPLLSTSRLLDPTLVGQDHHEVAAAARALLRRARALREGDPATGQPRALTPHDHATLGRARRLQRYLTQPFGVATPHTGRPGQVVPLAATLRDCRALLDGAYDDTPEDALLWRGALGQP